MLKLEGVVRQFSYGKRLFGAVDFTLESGEVLAVLGKTGAGKTTFLKTIAGIDDHEGVITLDDEPIPTKTHDVIMVFDDGALFKSKTVYDNLAYPLKIRKMDKVDIAKKVMQVAEQFSLVASLKSRPNKLTLLERRRVSLARILLREAKLLLLDDFLTGLTKEDADTLFDEVTRILHTLSKGGVSVIYVTDNPKYAFGFSDKVMVLVDGDVKQIGTHSDIWHNPQTVWSAVAVDKCYNALKGTLSLENDTLNFVFSAFDKDYTLDVTALKDRISESYLSQTVLLGWHAEDTTLCDNGITMPVTFIYNDKERFVLEGEGNFDKISVYSDKKSDTVTFTPDLDKVHFFDVKENSVMKRVK